MNNPTVSIIVPVYKVERCIRRCIGSILAQTYDDWELLLVDDGSPDNSGKICDEFAQKDPRIRVFHKPNGGVSSARNYGIENSRGMYLTFCDSDDYLSSDYLSAMMEAPESDIVYAGVASYDEGAQRESKVIVHFDDVQFTLTPADADKVIRYNLLAVGYPYGKLLKRSIIEERHIRFDARIRNHEDHLFCLEYLTHCHTVALSSRQTYFWGFMEQSDSLSHRTPDYRQMVIASDGFVHYFAILFEQLGINDKGYISRLTSEYGVGTRRAAVYCMYVGETDKARRLAFIDGQMAAYRSLYRQFGYKPAQRKHLLVYGLMMLPLPAGIKDFVYRKFYRK